MTESYFDEELEPLIQKEKENNQGFFDLETFNELENILLGSIEFLEKRFPKIKVSQKFFK